MSKIIFVVQRWRHHYNSGTPKIYYKILVIFFYNYIIFILLIKISSDKKLTIVLPSFRCGILLICNSFFITDFTIMVMKIFCYEPFFMWPLHFIMSKISRDKLTLKFKVQIFCSPILFFSTRYIIWVLFITNFAMRKDFAETRTYYFYYGNYA